MKNKLTYMEKSPKTIICDIDGTLIKHKADIVKNYMEII
jgi:hydroxymethylpyrimidine pyrophosphatase-like HAD family hydrolase